MLTVRVSIESQGGWKIENAIELLDAEEEFFYDEASRTLYLKPNATAASSADASSGAAPLSTGWVVPQLKQLLRVVGTKSAPVTNVSFRGIGFRDTAYTYLDEWGIPSGGDWALHRTHPVTPSRMLLDFIDLSQACPGKFPELVQQRNGGTCSLLRAVLSSFNRTPLCLLLR
jgi:hypothetical protein|eukprot:COSAG06_NODE_57_length_27525_cov_14.855279_39_plen_172_part_00